MREIRPEVGNQHELNRHGTLTIQKTKMKYLTRLHRCIDESRPACGMFFGLNSPTTIEMVLHGTELDFVGIELQHAPISADDSVHLLRAIQASDPEVTPFVRLPNHDVYWIQQSLDAGYAGLIVPLVESVEQAEGLVESTYFPPQGARSTAGSIRASMYHIDVATANQRMILLPQIESARGLEHVEEIVAVEGVSGVLLGPADLSLSCGWHGKDLWSHPPFLDAVRRVVTACHQNNKLAAILVGSGFPQVLEAGFDIIGFAGDTPEVRLTMTSNVNEKLTQLRSSDHAHSISPSLPKRGTTTQQRIESYRTCIGRFDDFIQRNLDKTGGGWQQSASADGYFSLIPYANYVGRRDWALRLLEHVAQSFVTQDIALKQNSNRDQMITYVPSWLAWGASGAESFELSTRWLDYVSSYQDPDSGGFFAGDEQRKNQRGPIDFDSTTMAVIALSQAGRVAPSVKGGDYLLQLCQAQPNASEQFFTTWNRPDGLITQPEDLAQTTVLRWADPKQHYYKVGLLVVALGQVYGTSGDRKYLDAARTIYDDTIQRAKDLWTNTISHKMCWAATTLAAITRETQYIEQGCRFADHLVNLQQSDGGFSYPELIPTYPPQRWEVIPNVGAQFTLWIARVLKMIEATNPTTH